jgi:hypothetical protein
MVINTDLNQIKAIGKSANRLQKVCGENNANRTVSLIENNLVVVLSEAVSSTDMRKILKIAERIGVPTLRPQTDNRFIVQIDLNPGPLVVAKPKVPTVKQTVPANKKNK